MHESCGHTAGTMKQKKAKRPTLDRLIDDARKRRVDVVEVWRFDRLARSTWSRP